MNNISPPKINARQVYENVKDRKTVLNKGVLEEIQAMIFDSYEIYEANSVNLENLGTTIIISDNQKKALIGSYTRRKDSYFEIEVINEIFSNLKKYYYKCPYCLISEPTTIDHYIPKDVYPEFSIFPQNLIPSCSNCNNKKSDNWKENNQRLFLHLYYDTLPSNQFLFCDISYNQNDFKNEVLVNFTLNFSKIEEYTSNIILHHYRFLDLLNRYNEIINDDFTEIILGIIEAIKLDQTETEIIQNLNIRSTVLLKKYGYNYWKYVLYEAIINSNIIKDILSNNITIV